MDPSQQEFELISKCAERLRSMAHPIRLMIIGVLKSKELPVTEISQRLDLQIGTVSQHLKVLERANLLCSRRDGRQIFYSICAPMAANICEVICEQLDHDLDVSSQQRKAFEELRERLQS